MLHMFEEIGIGVATTIGGTLGLVLLVVMGVVLTGLCVGVFVQQVGTRFLAADENACVINGLESGALIGLVFSLVGRSQLGGMGAFYSLLGLWSVLLFLSLLIWCFTARPQQAS
jgi:hypothetical protein